MPGFGFLAWFCAAKDGSEVAVAALLREGADVDARGMWDSTALICACQYRHESIALLLLNNGANVDLLNERGCTALLHCAVEGLLQATRALIAAGAEVNTPRAVVYNSVTDCNMLLTPLLAACTNGHVEVGRALLEAGARPDWDGRVSVQEAPADGARATDSRAPERTSSADASGGDVTAGCDATSSATTAAAPVDGLAAVQSNATCSAVERRCRWGTPLLHACRFNQAPMVALLLQWRSTDGDAPVVNVNAVDAAGCTPLLYACMATNEAMVVQLLEHGAAASVSNAAADTGLTPLHAASAAGLTDAVAALCVSGADVRAADGRGQTPLLLASKAGHVSAVQCLLRHGRLPAAWPALRATLTARCAGADPAAADHSLMSPMQVAQMAGHDSVLVMLRDALQRRGDAQSR